MQLHCFRLAIQFDKQKNEPKYEAMKYDVVIPLKPQESAWGDNNELKYFLRSLAENFPVGRVLIIASSLPGWLNKETVVQVVAPDIFLQNKDANIIGKILAAIKADEELSKTFFWSCDDHLVLRKPASGELKPFFVSELRNELPWWWSGTWKEAMKRTMNLLLESGNTSFHYDAHIPQPVDKDRFLKVMGEREFKERERYCINTLYFNQAGLRKHEHIGILKATFEKPVSNLREIETLAFGRLYLSYNNAGLTKELQEFIVNKFPNPSIFEK